MTEKTLVTTHICAECEAPLVERWNPETSQREFKCGNDKSHVGFKPYQESKSELERKGRQMIADKNQTALSKYSGSVALEKAEAEEILLSLWPDAPRSEVFKAALLCRQYGLNPLMKHIYLVGYKNKEGGMDWSIQIGIGATRMIARRSGAYSYIDDTPRLMTEGEQIKIFGEVDKTKFWAITKLMSKAGMTAQAYGNWPKDKFVKGADKGNTPQNMAFIRSERATLDKLFPEKLPAGVEVVASEYQEIPQIIDIKTGEITAGEDEKQIASGDKQSAPPSTTAEAPKPAVEGKAGQTTITLPENQAMEKQWQRIGELGKQLNRSTRDACEYVGKKTGEWKTITSEQLADIINAWSQDAAAKSAKMDIRLRESLIPKSPEKAETK